MVTLLNMIDQRFKDFRADLQEWGYPLAELQSKLAKSCLCDKTENGNMHPIQDSAACAKDKPIPAPATPRPEETNRTGAVILVPQPRPATAKPNGPVILAPSKAPRRAKAANPTVPVVARKLVEDLSPVDKFPDDNECKSQNVVDSVSRKATAAKPPGPLNQKFSEDSEFYADKPTEDDHDDVELTTELLTGPGIARPEYIHRKFLEPQGQNGILTFDEIVLCLSLSALNNVLEMAAETVREEEVVSILQEGISSKEFWFCVSHKIDIFIPNTNFSFIKGLNSSFMFSPNLTLRQPFS